MLKVKSINLIISFQKGFSLLEVVIAIAIFGLMASTMVTLATGGLSALEQGGEQTEAEALAQEGLEAVKSIRDRAWNENTYTTSSVSIAASAWHYTGENTTEAIGQFTRTISFDNVCRDGSNSIVECPGSYTDINTKKVTSEVSWTVRDGITNSVKKVTYLANWDSSKWIQTDWSGGSGQSIWSDTTRYNSDDSNVDVSTSGQVTLTSTDGRSCGVRTWPFTTDTNYTYDLNDIEVTDGVAQLVASSSSSGSGDTINQSFDLTSIGWTYNDWEESGNSVLGLPLLFGGNPNGYINISVDKKKNVPLSGYWEQAFTTSVDNPSIATTTFDWIVSQYSSSLVTSFQLYVFVDSTSGSPTLGQQVWSSGEINGTTLWASVPEIDVSSKLGTAGTYYLKVAVRVVTTGGGGVATGTNIIGFDNVNLHWAGAGSSSYPTDRPSIEPSSSYGVSGIDSWSSFSETATKNGGEIYYQLSDDDGSTWKYWNGLSWVTAGVADYNTASVVNTNISEFSTSTTGITFKAFLESDGAQLVQLNKVRIGWEEGSGSEGGYTMVGYIISSAFNMSDISPVQVIDWDQTIPSCSPICSITLQLRTAPDSGGSPGTWTSWYGVAGVGTYFTNNTGTLVPTVLNGNQWVQYRVDLAGDGSHTPVLDEVRVDYK